MIKNIDSQKYGYIITYNEVERDAVEASLAEITPSGVLILSDDDGLKCAYGPGKWDWFERDEL